MILFDALVSMIVIFFGFNLKNLFSGFTQKDKRLLNLLFFFHLLVAIVFHFYLLKFGGDAEQYWMKPKIIPFSDIFSMVLRGSPSNMMYFLNYFPSNVLGLSFFTGNMMYAQLGFLGFLLIYRISKNYFGNFETLKNFKILGFSVFPLIWFLPNMHFWSSGIGKDTLLFACIAAFIYGLHNLRKRFFWVFFGLLFATAVRPHITLFLLIAFGLGYLFDGKIKKYKKFLILLVIIAGMIPTANYVLNFVSLDSFETEAIEQYATSKSASLNSAKSGSGVDTSNYSVPFKMFTFLYRPLFYDINNVLSILASFENLILLIFTMKIFRKKAIRAFRKSDFLIKGVFLFFIIGALALSLILGNLGIMLRQKNMLFPWFILFGFWVYHYSNQNAQLNTQVNSK